MKTAPQVFFFAMLFLSSGCVTLYKPNAIHSPLLKEKGELKSSASLGLLGCGLYNLQAAYALSNHTGIMIDGMYHNRHINSSDSSVQKLNMFFGEAGSGYFNTFGDERRGLFQCYGGCGYGITNDRIHNAAQPNPEVNAKYFNVFIQPGVAFTDEGFEVTFDLRANYVRVFNIHAYLYDQFEFWNTDFQYYSDTTIDFMNLEPALTLKAGGERLKGVLQLGVTIPTINSHSYFNVNTSSMLIAPLLNFPSGLIILLVRGNIPERLKKGQIKSSNSLR